MNDSSATKDYDFPFNNILKAFAYCVHSTSTHVFLRVFEKEQFLVLVIIGCVPLNLWIII